MILNRILGIYLCYRLLHLTSEKHYPTCGCAKELRDKFADFFSDKIVTIRHQLDTLSITDAPDFAMLYDALVDIVACKLSEFSPTSGKEPLSSTFLWYKVVLTFESVDEILWCDHSNTGKLPSSTFLWYC